MAPPPLPPNSLSKPIHLRRRKTTKEGLVRDTWVMGAGAHSEETADEIIGVDVGETCPECGGLLKLKEVRDRTVIESELT